MSETSRLGRRLVVVGVAVALIVSAVIFRRAIIEWFSPGNANKRARVVKQRDGGAHGQRKGGGALPRLSPQTFSTTALGSLQRAFAAYERARTLLATDRVEGLADVARSIAAALVAARSDDSSAPVVAVLRRGARAARQLARSADIARARVTFGEVSRVLVALAAADARLRKGRHVFSCPMARGYRQWVQLSPRLDNPYMGKRMPSCGSRGRWRDPPPSSQPASQPVAATPRADDKKVAYHTCSMHPSVKQKAAGTCPICSMTLTPVTNEEVRTGVIFVDEARRQRIGVRIGRVSRGGMRRRIRTVARVTYDERRLADVTLRLGGWIKRLRVNATGQRVRRGQQLLSLYNPKLYAAQTEFLQLARAKVGGPLVRAARVRLRLWGLSRAQIGAIKKRGRPIEHVPVLAPASGYVIEKHVVEGAFVKAGTRLLRIARLDRVWVEGEVYESDLALIKVGLAASVTVPSHPTRTWKARVAMVYPYLQSRTRTARVRVVLANQDLALRPGMYANVGFDIDLGKRLRVPRSAVLYTGPRRLVFVDLGQGRLQPALIETGVEDAHYYEVRSGLRAGQRVVTSGTFLVAAESRIRSPKIWAAPPPASRRKQERRDGRR